MKKYLLLFIFLLTACAAQAPLQTGTTSPVSMVPSPTAVASIPAVSTQAISPTTPPTRTPTLIPSITPTALLTPTKHPFPKPDADSHAYWTYEISPDGQWIAWLGLGAQVDPYPHLIINNLAGDKSWLVTLPLEHHKGICHVACNIFPVLWSSHENFLYYYAFPADSDPGYLTLPANSVMKVSLHNGQISYVLPPRQDSFYYYAFSPDGEWLVLTLSNQPIDTFTLVNLFTKKSDSFVIQMNIKAIGIIKWSPHNHVFAFNAYGEDWESEFFLVNAQDYSYRKFDLDQYPLWQFEWISPSEIKLSSDYNDQAPLLLNTQTGETTPIEDTAN